jgi:hypothetical protein
VAAGVVIEVGYVDPDGVNTAAVISPSANVTGAALRDLAISAWETLGEFTPMWVDGSPPAVVNAISVKLGIPAGTPVGWYPTEVVADGPSEFSSVTFMPNRAQRRAKSVSASHVHRYEFKGVAPNIKIPDGVAKQFVCACGASQVRS